MTELARSRAPRTGLVTMTRRQSLCLAAAAGSIGWPGHVTAQTRILFDQDINSGQTGAGTEASPRFDSPSLGPSLFEQYGLQQQIDPSALGRMPRGGQVHQTPSVADFWAAPRMIWLSRRATGQSIKTVWWEGGRVQAQAYRELSQFLGDPMMAARIRKAQQLGAPVPPTWYQAVWVSPIVLDILYALGAWLAYFGMGRPVEVTSALRHPITNAATEGAAWDSLHQIGAAVDVLVPGVPAQKVAEFGAWMRGGGVGVYPQRGFTHLDAGRVRTWRG